MMFNRVLFCKDIDLRGGLYAVSFQTNILLKTLSGWYTGTRTPRFVSLGTIAVELGFLPDRYAM